MEIKTQTDMLLALEMVQRHLKDVGHFGFENIVDKVRNVLWKYAQTPKIFCCGNEIEVPRVEGTTRYSLPLGWPSVICPKCEKIYTISMTDAGEIHE